MLKIAHFSDLHLTSGNQSIWGVNTYDNFYKAIRLLNGINDIDAILVTGDISDDGSLESYQTADALFKQSSIPTYWCPGNHDSMDFFKSQREQYSKIVRSVIIKGYKIVFVNSVVEDKDCPNKNRSRGKITQKELEDIKKAISSDDLPVIIAMHHPSYSMNSWLDEKILINKEKFNKFVSFKNVKLVLFGHVHHFHVYRYTNPFVASASSIGFAFKKDLPKFQIDKGGEGCSILEINDEFTIRNFKI